MKLLSSCLHNNFSRAPHGLLFLHLVVQNTHGSGSCFCCLCKSAHLWAVNALRVCTKLPESLCQSSKIQNRTVYSWVSYCKTSRVQYQKKQKTMQLLSSWSPINFSTVPHGQTRMVQYQPVLQYFACIIVHLWAVNAFRTWPQLHSRFVHQARQRIETFTVEFVTAKQSQYITT